jgi:hypothetical protein
MELGSSNKSSVIIPLPIDLIRPLLAEHVNHSDGALAAARPGTPRG